MCRRTSPGHWVSLTAQCVFGRPAAVPSEAEGQASAAGRKPEPELPGIRRGRQPDRRPVIHPVNQLHDTARIRRQVGIDAGLLSGRSRVDDHAEPGDRFGIDVIPLPDLYPLQPVVDPAEPIADPGTLRKVERRPAVVVRTPEPVVRDRRETLPDVDRRKEIVPESGHAHRPEHLRVGAACPSVRRNVPVPSADPFQAFGSLLPVFRQRETPLLTRPFTLAVEVVVREEPAPQPCDLVVVQPDVAASDRPARKPAQENTPRIGLPVFDQMGRQFFQIGRRPLGIAPPGGLIRRSCPVDIGRDHPDEIAFQRDRIAQMRLLDRAVPVGPAVARQLDKDRIPARRVVVLRQIQQMMHLRAAVRGERLGNLLARSSASHFSPRQKPPTSRA